MTITGFNASSLGGAVAVVGLSGMLISNVTFRGNGATDGGAVHISKSININVSQCDFFENLASSRGGAIFIDYSCSNIRVSDTLFQKNGALCNGGAVFISTQNSFVSFEDS
jgi:predicted outer membrane repeat protein